MNIIRGPLKIYNQLTNLQSQILNKLFFLILYFISTAPNSQVSYIQVIVGHVEGPTENILEVDKSQNIDIQENIDYMKNYSGDILIVVQIILI